MGATISADAISKYDKLRKRKKRGSILIIGLDGSGKTSILYKMSKGKFFRTIPTMGHNRETVVLDGGKKKWDLFDIGGSIMLRETWRLYVPAADAAMFVVDASDSSRLAEAQAWIENLYSDDLNSVTCPIAILLNKQDKDVSRVSLEKARAKLEMSNVGNVPLRVFETSAKNGTGLYEAFSWLTGEGTLEMEPTTLAKSNFSAGRQFSKTVLHPSREGSHSTPSTGREPSTKFSRSTGCGSSKSFSSLSCSDGDSVGINRT